jgi:hypothetical protein
LVGLNFKLSVPPSSPRAILEMKGKTGSKYSIQEQNVCQYYFA